MNTLVRYWNCIRSLIAFLSWVPQMGSFLNWTNYIFGFYIKFWKQQCINASSENAFLIYYVKKLKERFTKLVRHFLSENPSQTSGSSFFKGCYFRFNRKLSLWPKTVVESLFLHTVYINVRSSIHVCSASCILTEIT